MHLKLSPSRMSENDELRIIPEIETIHNDLSVVHGYSAGLGYLMSDSLKDYNSVLAVQRDAADSIYQTFQSPLFQDALGNVQRVTETYSELLTPLSTAIADIGASTVSLGKLGEVASFNQEYLGATTVFSSLALDSIREQQTIIQNVFATQQVIDTTNFATLISPSIQTVGQGLSQMIQSLGGISVADIEVIPELETVRDAAEFEEVELLAHQERLDVLLQAIDPVLVEYRRGAWTAFNTKGEDYIGQASSSMRRVIDNLLRILAPEKEVAESEYFKNGDGAKDKNKRPTRKAKVLFIVNWDDEKAEHLKRLTSGFLVAYDNLSAWDHVPLNKDGFVHGALIAIEGHLLSLLTVNEPAK